MSVDWSSATVLSLAEFDVAWEMLDLGETPVALELPSPGTTSDERARIVREATATLGERGLVVHAGPVADLEQEMRLLARAEVFRDLVTTAPSRLLAVAASTGPRAVLAVRFGERVALVRLPTDRAVPELVSLLGPLTPGPGRRVQVPEVVLGDALRSGGTDRERFASELMRRGLGGDDAYLLLRMSEVTGVGQLGATHRSVGARRRAPYVLLVQATPDGCYRQRRVPRPGAETVVEAGPTDPATLVAEVDELVDLVRGSRPAGSARRSPV
ncbi:ESX secretion-associated protein EspG [Pseudonocardia sp. KRD291]|uniref:ESX secretion-associated protein EspG n=1 Tax=Pseudonocardia sp. KRD291 TaxID=2792007 RepID=UPI001C49D8B3|nr:ESX secretion-associated protein EspG [Pseudonocardia sp. KRD291]MBW0107119.1 ESX secretion-associated protein EspG [Pseudonocardia sp. KRD291]